MMIMPNKGAKRIYQVINEDDQNDIQIKWSVQLQLAPSDVDDDFDEDSGLKEFIVAAETFEDVVKYASQYIHLKSREDESWAGATILSVNKQQ